MTKYFNFKKRIFEIIEKAKDGDKASKFFDIFILTLIVLNVVAIVLESFNSLYINWNKEFKFFEVFSVVVFTIEYLLRLWTSDFYFDFKYNRIKSLVRFVFTPMALIDLFAILPFYLPWILTVDLRFLRIFRIFRIIRIFKLNRYTKALSLIIDVIKNKKDELFATVFIMGFMIIISAILIFYVEHDVQPQAFPNIIASIWWAIATLTTIGYGDVYPITPVGKILASIISLLGIGLVALPTGIISSGFLELVQKKEVRTIYKQITCPHCGKSIKINDE